MANMNESFSSRFRKAWNVFLNRDPTKTNYEYTGPSYSSQPHRVRLTRGNERSITSAIYNKIAVDVAAIDLKHTRLDENGRYVEDMESGLNNCLTLEANIDQTANAFKQDIVLSMFDEGSVAMVPVDTTGDPLTGSYDVLTMRTGRITEWMPRHVKVMVYNDRKGRHEEIKLPKSMVGIIENPFHVVMNEPNSTLKRLVEKLNLLDYIDKQSSSGKLDLIIQLPYLIKTDARRKQADDRKKQIEDQLRDSPFGIAYIDGTEKVTQLNRPVENNLMKTIEYLTSMLYSQLGITQSIMDGTADEKTMLNYQNRTIEPIVSAIATEMKRKFLTKTARSQRQSISMFRDPFKLVPVSEIAEIADKFTRNEIMTSNEIRQVVGMKPSKDPSADELRNKNLSAPSGTQQTSKSSNGEKEETEEIQNA